MDARAVNRQVELIDGPAANKTFHHCLDQIECVVVVGEFLGISIGKSETVPGIIERLEESGQLDYHIYRPIGDLSDGTVVCASVTGAAIHG